MTAIIHRSKAHLSFMTAHDQLLALCLVVSTFQFFPLLVLIYPFWSFALDAAIGRRLTSTQKKALRTQFNIPRSVIMRRKDKSECHVSSIPFFSILYVNSQILENLSSKVNRGIILHELGHHGRNDATVLLWLRLSLAIWLLMIPLYIAYAWIEQSGVEIEGVTPLAPITIGAIFYFGASVVIPLLILIVHYRYAHRREFVADTHAAEADKVSLFAFLNFGRWKKTLGQRRRWALPISMFKTHPSFEARIDAQNEGKLLSKAQAFWFTSQWVLLAVLIFGFSNMGAFPFIFPVEAIEWFWPEGVYFLAFFIVFSIGRFLSIVSSGPMNQNGLFWPIAFGYCFGGVMALMALATVNFFHNTNYNFTLAEGVALAVALAMTHVMITALAAKLSTRFNLPHFVTGLAALATFQLLNMTLTVLAHPEFQGDDFNYSPLAISIIWVLGSLVTTVIIALLVLVMKGLALLISFAARAFNMR